jgi:hypothetical protein
MRTSGTSATDGQSARRRALFSKLEVRPNGRGGWEVCWAGCDGVLFLAKEEGDAEDKAIDYIASKDGGHVVVHRSDALQIVTTVARLPSRAEILREGSEICGASATPLVTEAIAANFDVPDEDLKFAVSLWHICVAHPTFLSCETNFGVAYQYGPYVLLNRDCARFTFEECQSTAAAMRRLSEVASDSWRPRAWVPPRRGACLILRRSSNG